MTIRTWTGNALAVRDKWSISLFDAWASGDTIAITINGKDLTLTVDTDNIDQIADEIVAMVNGDEIVDGEYRNAIGSEIGEFSRITAQLDTIIDKITNGTEWLGATGATPPTGWTDYLDGGAAQTYLDTNGILSITSAEAATAQGMYQGITTVVDSVYRVTLTTVGGANAGTLDIGTTAMGSEISSTDISDGGDFEVEFTATATTTYIGILGAATAGAVTIDGVAVETVGVVELVADYPGVPYTITVTPTTAGSGDATLTHEATATGPNWFNNADNWSGNTVPVTGDTAVFTNSEIDCLYGLDTDAAGDGTPDIVLAELIVHSTYTGNIGLPRTNEDDLVYTYPEYRDQYLKIGATLINIGEGNGNGPRRVNIDTMNQQTTVKVYKTGSRIKADIPVIRWLGTHISNTIAVFAGDASVAMEESEAAHLASIDIGPDDSYLECGGGTDLTDAVITQRGGEMYLDSDIGSGSVTVDAGTLVLFSGDTGELRQYGGRVTIHNGTHTDVIVDAGTLDYRSSDNLGDTQCKIGTAATLDLTYNNGDLNVTNCELHTSGIINDPYQFATWTNGIDVVRASITEVTLELGPHLTVYVESAGTTVPSTITTDHVLSGTTTNNTPTEIYVNGVYGSRMEIPSDSTWFYRIDVAARRTDTDGTSAYYVATGAIDNNAGTTALVGAPSYSQYEDDSDYALAVSADNTNDALILTVTGDTGSTVKWVAHVTLVKATG